MLIVPHALHCIDGCFFVFYPFDSVAYCFGFSNPPTPSPHEKNNDLILFKLKNKNEKIKNKTEKIKKNDEN